MLVPLVREMREERQLYQVIQGPMGNRPSTGPLAAEFSAQRAVPDRGCDDPKHDPAGLTGVPR